MAVTCPLVLTLAEVIAQGVAERAIHALYQPTTVVGGRRGGAAAGGHLLQGTYIAGGRGRAAGGSELHDPLPLTVVKVGGVAGGAAGDALSDGEPSQVVPGQRRAVGGRADAGGGAASCRRSPMCLAVNDALSTVNGSRQQVVTTSAAQVKAAAGLATLLARLLL